MICVILGSLLRNMLGEWEPIYDTYAKELNISDNVKFMGQKANVQTYIVNNGIIENYTELKEKLLKHREYQKERTKAFLHL